MKLRNYFSASVILVSLAAMAVSCTNEMDYETSGISEITATLGDGTSRTVLADNMTSILWSPNDEISVFYNGDGVKFTSINSTPKDRTIFRSQYSLIYGGTETSSEPYLYAVYPYSESNRQEGEDITLTVPAFQTAVEGSFGRGAYPSVGRSKDTNIAFYNVCGGIRFTLCQNGIRKIVLKGNNNETLGGKVKVKFDENGRPKVSAVVEGEKSITLAAPGNGEFQTGKWYYISVLPTVLADGFNVEFIKRTDESERGTRTVTSSVEVKRSVFGSVENLDDDVVFDVGIGSLSISPAEVYVAPMSAVQLSLTVMPANAKYEWIKWSSTDKTVASVDEDGMVVGKKEGICTITATSDNGASAFCEVRVRDCPSGAVDLGLSVFWASVNLGASKPEENGRYFVWGDVVGQTWDGSKWSNGGFYEYPICELDSNGNLKPEYDAAHVLLGGKWRMPTNGEMGELIDNCTSEWTTMYGVKGRKFTSKKNSNSIFLPAAGLGFYGDLYSAGSSGGYWSITFYGDDYAWNLGFYSGDVGTSYDSRYGGYSVRPVSE